MSPELLLLLTFCLLAVIVFLTAQAIKYKNLYEKLKDDVESCNTSALDDEDRDN